MRPGAMCGAPVYPSVIPLSVVSRLLAALFVACLTAGCGGQDSGLRDAASTTPSLEVGTGADAFVPIADRDFLDVVDGCQGGRHVWVSVRVGGLDASDVALTLTLTRRVDGTVLSLPFSRRVRLTTPPGASRAELVGLAFVVDSAAVEPVFGDEVVLRASATDRVGASVSDERVGLLRYGGSACMPVLPDAGGDDAGTPPDAGQVPDAGGDDAGARDSGAPVDAGPAPELAIVFTDVTLTAGLATRRGPFPLPPHCVVDNRHTGALGDYCVPEYLTGGAAVADYDGDGDEDLFVARVTGASSLYRNEGDGTFVDVALDAGLAGAFSASGAAWGDVDADGDLDLYVTALGLTHHWLFIQTAPGRFTDEGGARDASLSSAFPILGMTPTFGDYDLDGDLDLYVTEWRNQWPTHDGPRQSRLLRNRGPARLGDFEDSTDAAGVSVDDAWAPAGTEEGVYTFAPAFVDLDGDRWPELVLASDFGTSRLFWNRRDGTFADGTIAAGVGTEDNAMGSSFGDLDGDGDLDWIVTSIESTSAWAPGTLDDGNRLYLNRGDRTFEDATDRAGLRHSGWGWGVAMFDDDNDGDLDVVATNGYPIGDYFTDPLRLWQNDGFPAAPLTDRARDAGIDAHGQGRGVVVWDYDDDGDLDLLVVDAFEVPALYRNDGGNRRDWLRVRVTGRGGNAEGLGARVTVHASAAGPAQVRVIGTTTQYMGQSERVAHFGLDVGSGPVARVDVLFPASGRTVTVRDVARSTTIVVAEP